MSLLGLCICSIKNCSTNEELETLCRSVVSPRVLFISVLEIIDDYSAFQFSFPVALKSILHQTFSLFCVGN